MSELSGNSLPSVTSEFAPTRQLLPIFALLRMVEPMPISVLVPMVQPCRITLWPMVQPAAILIGEPGSVCSMHISWMFVPSPISIHPLSPRITEPNQMPTSSLKTTLPITLAFSATQASGAMSGTKVSSW